MMTDKLQGVLLIIIGTATLIASGPYGGPATEVLGAASATLGAGMVALNLILGR